MTACRGGYTGDYLDWEVDVMPNQTGLLHNLTGLQPNLTGLQLKLNREKQKDPKMRDPLPQLQSLLFKYPQHKPLNHPAST